MDWAKLYKMLDKRWWYKTIEITLAIAVGVVIISYAQSKAIERITKRIEASYENLNCINVWKQMKKGDEV